MTEIWFIGDEITALGFRLAGVTVETPGRGEVEAVLERARASAAVVLLSAELASALPGPTLAALLSSIAPLTLVVPGATARAAVPDFHRQWRRRLGVEG
jgi:vacuolar-type H+-ATPase subunit F/Vma7